MRFLNYILGLLYPTYCLLCLQKGKYICDDCKNKLNYYNDPCCPVCKGVLRSKKYFIHKICQKHSSLDGLFPLLQYDEKTKLLLSEAKFKYAREILVEMSCMLKPLYANLPFKIDYLVPVPLNIGKLNYRGFNQSEVLTKGVNWRYKNILIRVKNTSSQARSDRKKRLINLRGAFKIDEKYNLKQKNIVLIDDVCTTGSTLQECAKTLKANGAANVIAVVWAKD